MKTRVLMLGIALGTVGAVTMLVAQQQPFDPARTPGVQAGGDPNRQAFLEANCRVVPAPPEGGGRGGGPAVFSPTVHEPYMVTGIPGVVETGARWRTLWVDTGNNADSPIGLPDGVLVAQNDKSQILKVRLDGVVELVATDTYTGGALAMTPDGTLYVGERALNRGIWRVSPREPFATTMNGEPLECLGAGVLNDMVADANGGIYMTMGGVYYVSPQGVVSGPYGAGGNGLALSPDGSILYVTGRVDGAEPPAGLAVPAGAPEPTGGLRAYDVQADGSLANERQFAWAGGDGTAVDTAGRIYSTGNGGTWVISPGGDIIGFIPAPRGMISVAFGGPDKRTLFGVSIRNVEVFALDMTARGL
jgi:sugar lactone lactonase YvrE